ncbi:MAG: type VI secretion system protein TssA [bacterium]
MAEAVLDVALLGRSPIREDNPAGEPVTYDPDFEAIKIEIAKLDSAAGTPPDYAKIVSLSTAILTAKSKDLTVACYLAHALFQRHGYAALREGFDLCRELLASHWENLFPEQKRMRARVGAMTWLNERAAAAVERRAPTAADAAALDSAIEGLSQLTSTIAEKFADDTPSTGELRRALEEAKRLLPSNAPPPSAAPAAAPSAMAAPPAAIAIDSADAAIKALLAAGDDAKRAALFLIQNDPGSPVPYLISRGVVWGVIRELPPNTDGVVPFPAPDQGLVLAWTGMADAGNWSALLFEAEQRFWGSPFWLDINRFVSRALDGLGHADARRAVALQTLALAQRLPEIMSLSFQGEVPFASDETRAWLAAESQSATAGAGQAFGASGAAPRAASDAAAPDDDFAAVVRDAKSLASKKKIGDAIRQLQERMRAAPSPRERFRWRSALASLCLDAGQTAVASAHYDALLSEVERHGLEEWEPALSFEVLEATYLCEKRMNQSGQRNGADAQARLGHLYSRLCRLDSISALALEKKK